MNIPGTLEDNWRRRESEWLWWEVKCKGMCWGRTIRSVPIGICSLATNPKPLEESNWAILTARWTKPPSLVIHLTRSCGWGAIRDNDDDDAHVSGRTWLSDDDIIIAVFQLPPITITITITKSIQSLFLSLYSCSLRSNHNGARVHQ
jgi:hypothetical protein